MTITLLLSSLALMLTPGAWIGFLPGRSLAFLGFFDRLAFSVALSPFILGLQIFLLTLVGLSFDIAAFVTLLNLGALFFVAKSARSTPQALRPTREWIAPIACFVVIAGALIALWTLVPNFRVYSWHNMMQAEAAYQLTRLPVPPEEMGLAGVQMNYAWFGHIQITAIGRIADAAPFAVFPIANVTQLFALYALLTAAAARLKTVSSTMASLLTAAALLSSSLLPVLASYILGPTAIGDIRVATIAQKFMHFDMMSNGEALFAGIVLLGVVAAQKFTPYVWALLWVCLTAVGLTYPLLFPAGLALSLAFLAAPVLTAWAKRAPTPDLRAPLGALASLIVAALIFFWQLRAFASESAGAQLILADGPDMKDSIKTVLRAYALWTPPLLFAFWRIYKNPDPARIGLALGVIGLAFVGVATHLPIHSEYKFVVASLFCAAPLVVEQTALWLRGLGKAATPAAIGIAAGSFLIMAPFSAKTLVPHFHLVNAVPLNEQHFIVTPAQPGALAWTQAVRTQTPANTILVAPAIAAPVENLTQRARFLARDPSPTEQRPGYSMISRDILTQVKSHPADIVDAREQVLASVYEEEEPAAFVTARDAIMALGRPVAFYFPQETPFSAWLATQSNVPEIYSGSDGSVVLLDAPNAS